jgi:hypothetical protein
LNVFSAKISPKEGAIQARTPHPSSAYGAFARGAAAEVLARDQDLRAAPLRLVEKEIGILAAVATQTQVVKQELAVARRARLAQEARRHDAVGIHVGELERCCYGCQVDEGSHRGRFSAAACERP